MELPKIHFSSNSILIDSQMKIFITGLSPYDVVTLNAKMRDNLGTEWESHAIFKADSDGKIDLRTAQPMSGTYTEVDETGLFWSMLPVSNIKSNKQISLEPLETKLVLIRQKEILDVISLKRHFVLPKVKRTPIREQELVATFFYHSREEPLPTIIVLGGSEGGLHEEQAALLASYGFNTLALAYFGMEDLPDELVNIPIDNIEKAINWLNSQPNVDSNKLGMMGTSKGGELALLSASMFPAIKAVVGYVPSSVVYPGISQKNGSSSSWNYKGEEIPYAKGKIPEKVGASLGNCIQTGKPLIFRDWYQHLAEGQTNAEISVENINGPVLLISGGDDKLWPSDIMSDRVIERLKRNNHPFYFEHKTYPSAGHYFIAPGMPTTHSDKISFASNSTMLLGGSPHDNAVAHADAWRKAKEFFKEYLGEKKSNW
ncbi:MULTISPECIES: acyl-CoA thioesterase/bile acid-CoA:amino acid N-acyltransferase family protein [Oceanobacillus]|uniref:Acyl-CoA thioesterase n=1 Tax=Oceanobacillus neutriphilus TaxID=531815 RepID=A0ABQ2NSR0_9BACI|nr:MULTISPECIES: acyl-CoA thioesterase/bile acid-CoA:amino acid N-acyltransferase family protein [Oceanobacillus]GGP08815.1 acyl-CoA thioesterase [Oceanobacillus neutriphilus]